MLILQDMKPMNVFYAAILRLPLWLMSAIALAILLWLTLMPSADLPEAPTIPFVDKWAHVVAFGLVASAIIFDWGRRNGRVTLSMWLLTALGMTVLGVVIEGLQNGMGLGRGAEVMDVVADAAGALLLPLLFMPLLKRLSADYGCRLVPVGTGRKALKRIKDLYFGSFPEEERRPWDDLMARMADRRSPLNAFIVMYKGQFAGFITWWKLDGMRYVEHFAVDPVKRGGGIGAKAIMAFVDSDTTPVVLEVEPASLGAMARRRIDFYSRCGFTPWHEFPYVQPPYAPGLPAVDLVLMTAGGDVDLAHAADQLHRRVYGQELSQQS